MEDLMSQYVLQSKNPATKKIYHKGEIIFHEDIPCFGLYYLTSGTVKIYTTDLNGREIILRLASKGDIFGHGYLYDEMSHSNSSKALEETTCHFIDGREFQALMEQDPKMSHIIMNKMGEELILYQKRCVELIKKNVRERLACYFHYMAEKHSEKNSRGIKIKLQLSREEIASMIGTANETAIRFISEFKELGLIEEEERFFHILDKDRLALMARPELF